MRFAGRLTLIAYVLLLALVVTWEAWWAPPTPLARGFWIAIKALPLVAPFPWLWRGSAYAHVLAALLLLIYFSEGVAAVYQASRTADAAYLTYGGIEIALSLLAIVAASVFARSIFRSPRPPSHEETGS